MFIGAALGILASQLPGLSTVAGVGIGVGAMSVAMLDCRWCRCCSSLLLINDAISLTPLIIVGVVTSYVVSARLTPAPAAATEPKPTRQ